MNQTKALWALLLLSACGPELSTPPGSIPSLRGQHDDPRALLAQPACSELSPRASPLETFAAPEVGEQPFLDAISGAQTALRVMVYQLTSPTIREAIAARARAGVVVQVILDQSQQPTNQASFDQLTLVGATVQWSDPGFSYTHAKFLVADDAVGLISTGNYDTYMHSGRNFGAIDRDPDDVRALAGLFDADWNHTAPQLGCTRLIVSPDNARARHLALLAGAEHTLIIESMQFGDWGVRQAVLARKQAGVSVRVLIASPSWVTENQTSGAWLKTNGIEARWRQSPAVHVKAFVIDGTTAFLGSENLSRTSLDRNREVGLATTESDDVALITSTFEKDWATATPF
jgi:phosphatidylserine/phosphatidylglycerophosphate/cardiolipin synthase-like enzyme